MRVRAAILVVLLSIILVTAGCQVVGLLPLYLGVEQAHAVVAARVGMAGIANLSVGRDGDHLVVVLPGLEDGTEELDALSGLLTAPGVVAFLPVPETHLGTLVDGQPVPEDMTALSPIVDGEGIASASVRLDEESGGPVIALELTAEAAGEFDDYASAHFGGQVAIVVDGVVAAVPFLHATKFGGQIDVSLPAAPNDDDEASQLAAVLRSGPLPLPLEAVSAGPCG